MKKYDPENFHIMSYGNYYRVTYHNKYLTCSEYFHELEKAKIFRDQCETAIARAKAQSKVGDLFDTYDLEFPENLLYDIGITNSLDNYYTKILPNFDFNFDSVKVFLRPRELEFLKLYYQENYTLEKIANIFDRTRERVRQVIARALRILKSKDCRTILLNEKCHDVVFSDDYQRLVNEAREQINVDVAIDILNAHGYNITRRSNLFLEKLDISNRLYNVLMRSGYVCLDDLCSFSDYDIMKIKGMGTTSKNELVELLKKHGLRD